MPSFVTGLPKAMPTETYKHESNEAVKRITRRFQCMVVLNWSFAIAAVTSAALTVFNNLSHDFGLRMATGLLGPMAFFGRWAYELRSDAVIASKLFQERMKASN